MLWLLSNGLKNKRQLIKVFLKLNYSLNPHLRNNSQWPPGHQNLFKTSIKTFFQRMLRDLCAIAKNALAVKWSSNQIVSVTVKLGIVKICSKIPSKGQTFLKTSEGQLFSERSKDIFSRVLIHVFRNSQDCYSFCYYSEKNITGNKLYILKLICEKKFFLNSF